jgi:NAD(P)-dependent dehydrogenase (short-subunit alcohol dehydrogenase family)
MTHPRVLIVTGASRGIGAATARLTQRGYAVCVNYRTGREQAETLVADLGTAGGRAI